MANRVRKLTLNMKNIRKFLFDTYINELDNKVNEHCNQGHSTWWPVMNFFDNQIEWTVINPIKILIDDKISKENS